MSINPGEKFPSGPKGHWLLGCLAEKRDEPIRFFVTNRERYGEIVSFKLGPIRVFQINSPKLIGQHFHSKTEFCIRGRSFNKLRPVLGDGLFTAEGEKWSTARKQLRPYFTTDYITSLEPRIRQIGEELCRSIVLHKPTDVKELAATAALKTVFSCILSVPWQPQFSKINYLSEKIKKTAHSQIHTLWNRFQFLPTANNRQFWSATRELRSISEDIVKLAEAEAHPNSPVLNLIQERNSNHISHKMLIDQITTMVVTGHETVANTLCWALELLALEESEQIKFAEAAFFKNRPESQTILKNAVKETIRLYPAAWIIANEAAKEHRIGGYIIPKGSIILTIPYTTHRDPGLWKEADEFRPARFVESDSWPPIAPYQYIPFGGGSRFCIGRTLAELEIQIILEEILKRFRVGKTSRQRTPAEFSMTLLPQHSINLNFSLRDCPAEKVA